MPLFSSTFFCSPSSTNARGRNCYSSVLFTVSSSRRRDAWPQMEEQGANFALWVTSDSCSWCFARPASQIAVEVEKLLELSNIGGNRCNTWLLELITWSKVSGNQNILLQWSEHMITCHFRTARRSHTNIYWLLKQQPPHITITNHLKWEVFLHEIPTCRAN